MWLMCIVYFIWSFFSYVLCAFVISRTGFVNGRWQFSTPPPEITPLDRSPKKLVHVITSAVPTTAPNVVQIRRWGGFWANRWNITKFFFIYTFFHQLTYRSDPSTDFYDWWLKRRGLAQGCALWRIRGYFFPFWGWNPPKTPILGDVNRRFQARRTKYWKFHVIESNASISTNFCTTIETIKKSSWMVPVGAQQIQDGGRPPFWKKRQIAISLQPFNRFWKKVILLSITSTFRQCDGG